MIKKYNQYIKENNIVYSSDEIDPYGEEDWDNDEILTPVLKIAKKTGQPYDKIKTLYCNIRNLMTLDGIEKITNLSTLICSSCNLTNLEGIENLSKLEYLDCENNNLISLKEIENLVELKMLFCQTNNLTNLEGIENLSKLETLYCYENNFSEEYEQYLMDYCKNKNIELDI